jgi:hypothetical protein
MALRRVKPNRLYGFRTSATLSNESIWYEANAVAGRLLLGAAVLSAAVSLGLFFVLPAHLFALAGLTFLSVAILTAALFSISALRRIAP